METTPKQQAVERLQSATNILVTVSKNPNVDQLAACIGLTLMLNKMGKHATAVFSGEVPSTLEFLQPDKTIEQNTDSLRDFIIALDKSKADKLRYKVEDEVVRIFITPYHTSISDKDLEFSQGDFNVDVVVALGVTTKEDVDQAILAHGRILHDAVVMTLTNKDAHSDVGSINWHEDSASSLCEMIVTLSEGLQVGQFDGQMATALLTGIVAETDRFSNDRTTPRVMTLSAQLMGAGANQQLIATKLTPPEPEKPAESLPPIALAPQESTQEAPQPVEPPKNDGEIEIQHDLPPAPEPQEPVNEDEIHIDDQGNLKRQEELRAAEEARAKEQQHEDEQHTDPGMPTEDEDKPVLENKDDSYIAGAAHKVLQPLGDTRIDPLAAFAPQQTAPAPTEPAIELPAVQTQPDLTVPTVPDAPIVETPQVTTDSTPQSDTLSTLEQVVQSTHLDDARSAVETASLDSVPRPQASQAIGAQHIDINPQVAPVEPAVPTMPAVPAPTMAGVGDVLQQTSVAMPDVVTPTDPMAPPPVPPPMMPQFLNPQTTTPNIVQPSNPTVINPTEPQQPAA